MHQLSDTCLKLAHDTDKSMIKIAIKGVTHTFDSQFHFSDNAGKDIHLKTWSHTKGFSTMLIYIYYIYKSILTCQAKMSPFQMVMTLSDGLGNLSSFLVIA